MKSEKHLLELNVTSFGTMDGGLKSTPFFSKYLKSMMATLVLWIRRERQRYLLKQLDTHQLKDVGISPEQAEWESNKWFWKA